MNSELQQRSGIYSYEVEPFQEDFTGHMAWGFLGNHLLKCASLHANANGFGVVRLNEGDYSWVLSRMIIEMKEVPKTGDKFTIETWIRNTYRFFTDRCFELKRDNGDVLGYAYTIWAIINMETRQPADLTHTLNNELSACFMPDKLCPVQKASPVRVKKGEAVRIVQTYYSDIDINNHVNSIRYIEHVLDLFPKERYERQYVSRMEVAYNEECTCGEQLILYMEEIRENVYAVEVHKKSGGVACRCGITFSDYKTNEL